MLYVLEKQQSKEQILMNKKGASDKTTLIVRIACALALFLGFCFILDKTIEHLQWVPLIFYLSQNQEHWTSIIISGLCSTILFSSILCIAWFRFRPFFACSLALCSFFGVLLLFNYYL